MNLLWKKKTLSLYTLDCFYYEETRNLYYEIKTVSIITFTLLNFEDQQIHRSELLYGSNFLLKRSMLETIFWPKAFLLFSGQL